MYKTTKSVNGKYDLSGDLKNIKIALANVTRDARGKAEEAMYQSLDDVKKRSARIQKNVNHYIIDQPIKSLSFAMLAGMIMGYFLHRK